MHMGISFVSGKVLILIIPAIILVIWLYKNIRGISSIQDKLIVTVRCVLVSFNNIIPCRDGNCQGI